ncbi:MAG: response regulator transcription factor [Desulfovibrio sp.]
MRVLLVEDDKTLADYVQKGLRESGYVVDRAATGTEGKDYALSGSYDVAVIDIMLPGMDGLSLIAELRGQGISMPVLILSARQSVDDKVLGLQTGGDDYMTKPFSFAELLARVQALTRRASVGTIEKTLKVGDISLNRFTREVHHGETALFLQAKEHILLEYMMNNSGRIITKTMILEHVWDYGFDPQTNVVEVLVHRLRAKVDKPFGTNLIQTIRGVGYVFGSQK